MPVSSQPHAELRAIGKRFGGVVALRRISLAVHRGEIHGLVGENGAGKSTLGKIVAGVVQPDEGALIVAGREVWYRSPRQALEDGVTFIAQERLLVETRSVIENVFLGVEPAWRSIVDRRRLRARYSALRERTGFDLPPHAGVRDLRAADRQKVEVMRALARDADLVIMDEPTAGLTRDEATELLDVVSLLKTQGATVLYISHTLEEVLSVADTVSVLRAGELVRSAPTASESVGSLVTAMLGRLSSSRSRRRPSRRGRSGGLVGAGPHSFWPRRRRVVRRTGRRDRRHHRSHRQWTLAGRETRLGCRPHGCGNGCTRREPLRMRSPRDAIRHGIVLLPESREDEGLMMRRSIVENIALPHLKAVSRAAVLRRRYGRGEPLS